MAPKQSGSSPKLAILDLGCLLQQPNALHIPSRHSLQYPTGLVNRLSCNATLHFKYMASSETEPPLLSFIQVYPLNTCCDAGGYQYTNREHLCAAINEGT